MSAFGDVYRQGMTPEEQARYDEEQRKKAQEGSTNLDSGSMAKTGENTSADFSSGGNLGLTGDTGTDEQIMSGQYGAGKSWPALNREDYRLAPSTGPDNRMGVTGRAEEAWRAGAQQFWDRRAPVLNGVDRGYEMAAGHRQQNAQDVAIGGTEQTGLLARQMAGDRGMYLNAAQGLVPSAAELQMQQGAAQAARNQLALASSMRTPGAAYQAQVGIGALQRQNLADTAVLRAQEQAQARGELTARDTAEANVRNAYVNQALGVGAGESQAYQNALGLNAQELQRQQWGAQNQLAQSGLNDQTSLGMMGLSNEFYRTGNQLEQTAQTRDIAGTDFAARWNEAQADQFQRWLAQWVQQRKNEQDRAAAERGAITGAGGSFFGTLLSAL